MPEVEPTATIVDTSQMNLLEAYTEYYKHERGQDTPEVLQQAFKELLELQDEVAL